MVIFHSYVTLPEGIWAFLTALYPKHPFDPHMMTGRSTVIHLFLHRGMFLIFSGHCQKLCCKFCLRLASTMAKVTIKCNLRKDSRSLCRCHMPLPSAWSKSLWPKPCDCSKATDGRVSSSSWRYQAACSLPPSSCHLLSVLNSESVGICCSLLRFLEILDIEVVLGPATEAPDRMTRTLLGKRWPWGPVMVLLLKPVTCCLPSGRWLLNCLPDPPESTLRFLSVLSTVLWSDLKHLSHSSSGALCEGLATWIVGKLLGSSNLVWIWVRLHTTEVPQRKGALAKKNSVTLALKSSDVWVTDDTCTRGRTQIPSDTIALSLVASPL